MFSDMHWGPDTFLNSYVRTQMSTPFLFSFIIPDSPRAKCEKTAGKSVEESAAAFFTREAQRENWNNWKQLYCVCMCVFPVPTALRVNGPTNGLGVDGRPPLLSPSQVSLGPQAQGYRPADLGDSPSKRCSLLSDKTRNICNKCSKLNLNFQASSVALFSTLMWFCVSVCAGQYLLPWTQALQRSATGAGIPTRWCLSHQQPSLFLPSDQSLVPQVSSFELLCILHGVSVSWIPKGSFFFSQWHCACILFDLWCVSVPFGGETVLFGLLGLGDRVWDIPDLLWLLGDDSPNISMEIQMESSRND